ncbi:bifunctional phosphoribosylaminoimidazolecarboxamide formyltransferase/IMP cyclohydrolase [bacterium]|nr:bifunctional phosphoribosylaminoimidazolecarboxamide formyltransferase/IMP cyclohydrolase [bacterium]MBT4121755.1 bifunctional phosphoribosylaminoimidazolecarboxamide formyltransferase/IMP cyclohydrolase [bacterium]MBT4334882.1 bifunctional phosphoribosylaminoimidazolecarboxamide formyltransferase/IMP cyclohydrolase [bacterium]MBT4763962.1 bifunctional phosphoribosylaminoimidazolecarboxamide formyltransferase/IMP cyclohydrolase [bacterium]MBT5401333.1 bifunctional phosphoribosylaminoimidazol
MKRALISVYDKTGIVEFSKELVLSGWEIISTGGTYKLLKENNISNLKEVSEVTNFPEIMNGRVKTLDPHIYGGLLAVRNNNDHLKQAKENNINMIDMVVVNLYPFEETLKKKNVTHEEIIENIDIGGPTMIRAAAKNYESVYVVTDLKDYNEVIRQLGVDNSDFRKKLAEKAFKLTSEYDFNINNYFSSNKRINWQFEKLDDLRYGENPYQKATFFKEVGLYPEFPSIVNTEVLHGKQLSYNNIMDADAALALIQEFDMPAAAVLKHANPCGVAQDKDITKAFKKAYLADSKSAFGGVIILNKECSSKIAEEINKVFAEIVMAPSFEKEALNILKSKKNLRILKIKSLDNLKDSKLKDYRKVVGGLLVQDYNNYKIDQKDLKIVTDVKPDNLDDLIFGYRVVKHIKSNAICLVKDGVTLGIGAGQMSRVDAVEIAMSKAGSKAKGSALASDAFFPFRDSIDKLAEFGVKSIIQPGGSIKDDEIIEAANEHKISMVFTQNRVFKH